MTFLALLAFKRMTIYRLSQFSGAPKITLADLCSGKTSLLDSSGKTLLAISKSFHVSIEGLLQFEPEEDKKKRIRHVYTETDDYEWMAIHS